MKKNVVCIAGKNEIAVYALSYLLKIVDCNDICFIPNSTDKGNSLYLLSD